jgi:hypothetical protein
MIVISNENVRLHPGDFVLQGQSSGIVKKIIEINAESGRPDDFLRLEG